jgi:hypothetical protein
LKVKGNVLPALTQAPSKELHILHGGNIFSYRSLLSLIVISRCVKLDMYRVQQVVSLVNVVSCHTLRIITNLYGAYYVMLVTFINFVYCVQFTYVEKIYLKITNWLLVEICSESPS